ncbi:hypothetical protein EVAR_38787_1 [Eumeta japonica]|uniref:Uncharacterized protein n=1 Tax=Eumeta variegata TaxID=151549 RepID=A0A4C1WK43_EUMVA|nr:hypothetical protein EVAR_38787_1 [Eumeta japonica]
MSVNLGSMFAFFVRPLKRQFIYEKNTLKRDTSPLAEGAAHVRCTAYVKSSIISVMLRSNRHDIRLILEPESTPVSEFTSCRAHPRVRVYSWLILEPESIPVSEFTSYRAHSRVRVYSCERETHRIQGLVYLFTLQGSGQAPLWYTPEKISVPKAWFTGSTCLALASSLEYILEVFLF